MGSSQVEEYENLGKEGPFIKMFWIFLLQGDLVRKLKSENAPAPDVEVAIKELKVRKKALENKVQYEFHLNFSLEYFLCIVIKLGSENRIKSDLALMLANFQIQLFSY